MSGTDFQTFWAARKEAAKAYVVGDGSAVDELVPDEGEATFFTPLGDVVSGAPAVAGRYRHDSEAIHPEGTTRFEVLHGFHDGDLAFWAGYEITRAHVGSMPDAKDLRSRQAAFSRRACGLVARTS